MIRAKRVFAVVVTITAVSVHAAQHSSNKFLDTLLFESRIAAIQCQHGELVLRASTQCQYLSLAPDADSDSFADTAITFARWLTTDYRLDTRVALVRPLRDAPIDLGEALEHHGSDDVQKLLKLLNKLARSELNLALHSATTREDPVTGNPPSREDSGDLSERTNITLEHFIRGQDPLGRLLRETEEHDMSSAPGLAVAKLGDWMLLYDRLQSSAKNYRLADTLLRCAGLSERELAIEFDSPHCLDPSRALHCAQQDLGHGLMTMERYNRRRQSATPRQHTLSKRDLIL